MAALRAVGSKRKQTRCLSIAQNPYEQVMWQGRYPPIVSRSEAHLHLVASTHVETVCELSLINYDKH
jgi:hypothetical protein